ncbi:MAG: hypothetical protein BAJALOKI2v1_300043, partial [Promethearchaeota archaeon]
MTLLSRKNHLLSHGYVLTERFIISICLILMFFLPLFMLDTEMHHPNHNGSILSNDHIHLSQDNETAAEESVIFQGNASALDITDYGNSYHLDQEVSVNNESERNLEYYLDSQHGWKVSKIENQISNIQDTRNWINNGSFFKPNIYRVNKTFESEHPYEYHWTGSPHIMINHSGALAIRA